MIQLIFTEQNKSSESFQLCRLLGLPIWKSWESDSLHGSCFLLILSWCSSVHCWDSSNPSFAVSLSFAIQTHWRIDCWSRVAAAVETLLGKYSLQNQIFRPWETFSFIFGTFKLQVISFCSLSITGGSGKSHEKCHPGQRHPPKFYMLIITFKKKSSSPQICVCPIHAAKVGNVVVDAIVSRWCNNRKSEKLWGLTKPLQISQASLH